MNCNNIQRSLEWCEGRVAIPGLRRRIYYIAKSEIVSWGENLETFIKGFADGTLTSKEVTTNLYPGNITTKADVPWKAIDTIADKTQLTSEAQGEYPSQTQLNKLTAVHPDVGEKGGALALYVNNHDCAFLVEGNDGKFRLVGSPLGQTKASVSQDLGQGLNGTASTTLNAEATWIAPAPVYVGTIVTEEGELDCETGKVTVSTTSETTGTEGE